MQLNNEQRIFDKRISHIKNLQNILINFIDIFHVIKILFNAKFLIKLDGMPALYKLENWRTQLNESEVKGLKFISVKLRGCNLYFHVY